MIKESSGVSHHADRPTAWRIKRRHRHDGCAFTLCERASIMIHKGLVCPLWHTNPLCESVLTIRATSCGCHHCLSQMVSHSKARHRAEGRGNSRRLLSCLLCSRLAEQEWDMQRHHHPVAYWVRGRRKEKEGTLQLVRLGRHRRRATKMPIKVVGGRGSRTRPSILLITVASWMTEAKVAVWRPVGPMIWLALGRHHQQEVRLQVKPLQNRSLPRTRGSSS